MMIGATIFWLGTSATFVALLACELIDSSAFTALQMFALLLGFVFLFKDRINSIKGGGVEVTLEKIERIRSDIEAVVKVALPMVAVSALTGQRIAGNEFKVKQSLYRRLIDDIGRHSEFMPGWVVELSNLYRRLDADESLPEGERELIRERMKNLLENAASQPAIPLSN